MHALMEYPFDTKLLLRKRKAIKSELIAGCNSFTELKMAILGGSTTHDITEMLELFLLNHGIKPSFYESEYAQYWQDAVFDNSKLNEFAPDIIYIHTNNRNISHYPNIKDSESDVEVMLRDQYNHYEVMWNSLQQKYHCAIIQNNFEMPYIRLLGNKDASDIHGHINYLSRLNMLFYKYASQNQKFFINDINYQSASYGLEAWSDPACWHLYKYSLCLSAIPLLAFNVANIVKSLMGKNKKGLVLDLDNTLWGGVIGDDGVEGIEIGHETAMGEGYSEFQKYIKSLKDLGVTLNVNSKNDRENALKGLTHPESTLHPNDFIIIKANWETKDLNFLQIANELSVLPSSLVFVDDNPAERAIVKSQIPDVSAPNIDQVQNYAGLISRAGFFEVTNLSDDDLNRNRMYEENALRHQQQASFSDYNEYLRSLQMEALITGFNSVYISRIAQLTNKSNQFNLTTQRYTVGDIEKIVKDGHFITLYGKLEDKFGDNGIVSVVIGEIINKVVHIRLWLMSCRVLKRGMEYAMMDEMVAHCIENGIEELEGYYYPTSKNGMVREFYKDQGFEKVKEDESGNTQWRLKTANHRMGRHVIEIKHQ